MPTNEQIVEEARSWIGTPYHHQAAVKGVGCDCLGFVRGVYEALGYDKIEDIPPYSRSWGESDGQELMLEAARKYLIESMIDGYWPGCVVVFRFRHYTVAKHVAIISYNGRMIHAIEGSPVSEVSLNKSWVRRIAGVFVFPPLEGEI